MRRATARRAALALLIVMAAFAMGQRCGGGSAVLTAASSGAVPDADGDGVRDDQDNCRLVPNRSQLDTGPTGEAVCEGATNRGAPSDIVFGTCRNEPDKACLVDRDCARGNACDCDFTGDGVCDIDDFNRFLMDYATGTDTAGTDMNGDGVVDDLDFALFEPLFAQGAPGVGSSEARVIDADGSAGACFDRRQGRRIWASEGRAEAFPNVTSNDLLDCSVDPDVLPSFVVLGLNLTPAQIQAMRANKNNPTDAFVEIASGQANRCPNAVFSIGDKTAPRACDAHDLCLDHCGYAVDECNRQFYRDLFHTCEALQGLEAGNCFAACTLYARIYASSIAGELILVPPVGPGADPTALEASDLSDCQCGPPVCEIDEDCLDQQTAPARSRCDRGYCVHVFANDCTIDFDCSPGYRCRPDLDDPTKSTCIWDVTALPDRRGTPPPVCGDGLCEKPVETCASTSCPEDCGIGGPVAEGFGRCDLGDACLIDLDCALGACFHGSCQELANGSRCDAPTDCASESCDVLTGLCKTGCLLDADCATGVCSVLGECITPQPDGSVCDANSDCASGACNFPICVPANSVAPGSPCTTGIACQSGTCTAGFCAGSCGDLICTLVPDGETCFEEGCQVDCGRCPDGTPGCDADADCAGGLCGGGVCLSAGVLDPGDPCLFSRECRSGTCSAGFCRGSCGDGFCTVVPNGETCFSCSTDCGRCPNGTPGCTSGSQCASGTCVLGFCVASCKPFTAACSQDVECCSGNCARDILGNLSCGL
jgi:hypothetical protein